MLRNILSYVLALGLICAVQLSAATAAEDENPPAKSAIKRPKAKPGVDKGAAADFPRGQWVDLLKRIDPKKRSVGDWQMKEKELAVAGSEKPARLVVPVAPGDSYDLKIEFMRTEGDGMIGFILPVGPRQCLAAVSFNSGPSGIDMIDGRRADKNDSTMPGVLTNGRRYVLEIAVRLDGKEAAVTLTLDDRPFVFYRGPASALALHKDWTLPQKNALGLAAQSDAVFHKLQFRSTNGGAKEVK